MTKTKQLILTFICILLLASCQFINNTIQYKDTTKSFIEALIKEDYNQCISLLAIDHNVAKNINRDTLKMGLSNFRQIIVNNWGTDLEFSFMKSEKKMSTIEAENTPKNATLVLYEFYNKKDVGAFQVLFDDKSKKIITIKTLDIKIPKPKMYTFWLFGIVPICVLLFNIYVIRQIKKSTLPKKWLKYLAVLFFNVPTISYTTISGLSFTLFSFQIFFGISFSYMGYLGSVWTFGIPLGGIYWIWKLKQRREAELYDIQIEASYSSNDIGNPNNQSEYKNEQSEEN